MHEQTPPLPPSDSAKAAATKPHIAQLRTRLALYNSGFDFGLDPVSLALWPPVHSLDIRYQQGFGVRKLSEQLQVQASLLIANKARKYAPFHPYGQMIGRSALDFTRQVDAASEQVASLNYQLYEHGHVSFSAHLSRLDVPDIRATLTDAWEALSLPLSDLSGPVSTIDVIARQAGPQEVQSLGSYVMGLLPPGPVPKKQEP